MQQNLLIMRSSVPADLSRMDLHGCNVIPICIHYTNVPKRKKTIKSKYKGNDQELIQPVLHPILNTKKERRTHTEFD